MIADMKISKIPPVVILAEPQLGENIGTAVRAMANFGLEELRLVAPRDGWPNEAARKPASGADHIIDNTKVFANIEDAIADLHCILATTARPRDMLKPVMTPEVAGRTIHTRTAAGQKCGILFGRERWGLNNDEIALCNAIVMAPVNPQFSSINIAQAVLLLGYEWFKQGSEKPSDNAQEEELPLCNTRPANSAELAGFFGHLESELDSSGFLRPVEKRPTMVRSIRNMFKRMDATEQEIRTLRGVISSLTRVATRKSRSP